MKTTLTAFFCVLAIFLFFVGLVALKETAISHEQIELEQDIKFCKDKGMEPVIKLGAQTYVRYCIPKTSTVTLND